MNTHAPLFAAKIANQHDAAQAKESYDQLSMELRALLKYANQMTSGHSCWNTFFDRDAKPVSGSGLLGFKTQHSIRREVQNETLFNLLGNTVEWPTGEKFTALVEALQEASDAAGRPEKQFWSRPCHLVLKRKPFNSPHYGEALCQTYSKFQALRSEHPALAQLKAESAQNR